MFSKGTIKKIFKSERDENLSPQTLKLIEDYIYEASLKPPIVRHNKTELYLSKRNYPGANLIDEEFRRVILNDPSAVKAIDFYTCKSIDSIQWKGVLCGLYIERPISIEIKKAITQSYLMKNSKICALVTGSSGSGKSTLLRDLAIQCIPYNFKILWINSIHQFITSFEDLWIPNEQYLLFIEDWNTVEKSVQDKNAFLEIVAKKNNLKLVIGDYHSNRDYSNLIYHGNIFVLPSSDNVDIIKRITEKTPEWEYIDFTQFLGSNVISAPLYLVIFVIAKSFELTSDGLSVVNVADFYSEFKKIVKNDLAEIYRFNSTLSKVIYWWACIYKEFGIDFSYQALLKITDSMVAF